MFVSKSKFEEVKLRADRSENKAYYYFKEFDRMRRKFDSLVDRINALGGENFLRNARIQPNVIIQFDSDDLQRLIFLCHPDKHDGKDMATEMTKKLLKMKKDS